MSEGDVLGITPDPGKAGALAELSAGMMLRQAREAAGLHVAALAVSMKIPVKKLEALEADRLELLHDAVFVRALAASVCRALKVDPTAVLQKLPLNTAPRLNSDERGINAPFHATGHTARFSVAEILSKPSAMIAIALLVAGAAVIFFPEGKLAEWSAGISSASVKPSEGPAPTQAQQPANEAVEPTSLSEAPKAPKALEVIEVLSDSVSQKEILLVPVNPALSNSASSAVKNLAPPPPLQTPSQSATTQSIPVSNNLVVFRAKGPSWVKVVDAKGIVQLSKTLADGETVGASGVTPLSIVIGRVDATDVEVRGKPYSLVGVSKDNVARFEVK